MSSTFLILTLDQLVQTVGKSGTGVNCVRILHIRVLGCVDDAALVEPTVEVEEMTRRLTDLVHTSIIEADMFINMKKTVSQHVQKRDPIKVTKEKIASAEENYVHQHDFCIQKFKTNRTTLIY